MSTKLGADEFVVGPTFAETSGRTVIDEFGFDPKLCDITASDDGTVLCIKQKGCVTFVADSPYWRRVPPTK